MTTIDKVAICGIRSYDPQSLTVVKFFKPLTIILGNNGCGKTTIIESLKYVCTGDVPPFSQRGRAFVHDPCHCSISCVKATVKVAFKNRDGKPVIVNSSMQLTQKKNNKTEFKTIDGVVRMYDENSGDQIALSHKCADMKKVVPQLMGVSRAILDNVIFCHQEESDWPLSEAKKLKEKFDEIFATSRWSKALTNINQYRKTLNIRAKDLKNDLIRYQQQKEQAHKLQSDLQSTKIRMASYKDKGKQQRAKIEKLKAELIPEQEAHEKIRGFEGKQAKLISDAENWKERHQAAHERMQSEYEETDEELNKFLKDIQGQMIEKENERKQHEVKYEKLKREMNNKKHKMDQLNMKRGELNQIMNDCKNKEKELLLRMKGLRDKYKLQNQIGNDDMEDVDILKDNPQIVNSLDIFNFIFSVFAKNGL